MRSSLFAAAGLALVLAACQNGPSGTSSTTSTSAATPPPSSSATASAPSASSPARTAQSSPSATSPPAASPSAAGTARAAPPAAATTTTTAIATEAQAKAKLEASGYSNVGSLTKDSAGIWHGMAMRNGMSVMVALDAQGNVRTE
jgi:hypothetical protein